MKIESQKAFDQNRKSNCGSHRLSLEGITPRARSFSTLQGRFFDGDISVELVAVWNSPEGLETLALHRNGSGSVIMAHDSRRGRVYHFPIAWMGGRVGKEDRDVNAWSRFSPTPDGPISGYKQQRFARSEELYFDGGRILSIDGAPTSDQHTGQMLHAALKAKPEGVSLVVTRE
ncbi:MAG: hypothetical protein ACI8RZ_006617 [Myxococcota bacterium]